MPTSPQLLTDADLDYLRDLTRAVLEAAMVRPGEAAGSDWRNQLPITIIRPGGGECYPAFWTRDMIMSVDSGLIDAELLLPMFRLLAGTQAQTTTRPTEHIEIPAGAITDHIMLDHTPVFYPGGLVQQQAGVFGRQPPYDDHFYFIHLAWYLIEICEQSQLAHEVIDGREVLARLDAAFAVTPADTEEFAVNTATDWAISFGFTDTVHHGGKLLFASLLRYRAARELATLHRKYGSAAAAAAYDGIAASLREKLETTFADASGLLRAATEVSTQPDVWGSALAVRLDAVSTATAQRIAHTLATLYREKRLSCRGAIRHVPEGLDFAPGTQCWERPAIPVPYNTYQHGAYWSTPTGHVARAIALVDPEAARQLLREFIADLREHDFRHGDPAMQAPYECFHPGTNHAQNPVYLTSVSCPLAVLQ